MAFTPILTIIFIGYGLYYLSIIVYDIYFDKSVKEQRQNQEEKVHEFPDVVGQFTTTKISLHTPTLQSQSNSEAEIIDEAEIETRMERGFPPEILAGMVQDASRRDEPSKLTFLTMDYRAASN